jgi:ABC-type phosphate transport system permease subunit
VPRVFDERRKDRAMATIFRMGGGLVVLLVVLIVVGLAWQTLPLLTPAGLEAPTSHESGEAIVAGGCDPWRERSWSLDTRGSLSVHRNGSVPVPLFEDEPIEIVAADHEIHCLVTLLSEDGTVVVGSVRPEADRKPAGDRPSGGLWRPSAGVWRPAGDRTWSGATANTDRSGDPVAAVWGPRGVAAARWHASIDRWEEMPKRPVGAVSSVAIAEGGDRLALVGRRGTVRVLRFPDMTDEPVEASISGAAQIRFLIGGGTLVIAGSEGEISVALRVPRVKIINHGAEDLWVGNHRVPSGEGLVAVDDGVSGQFANRQSVEVVPVLPLWKTVRRLPAFPDQPTAIAPGHRDRSFAVGGNAGWVAVYHATSGRRLVVRRWSEEPIAALSLAPRGDALLASTRGAFRFAHLSNPDPAISFRTLFLPVWYEGHAAPANIWQTSGGSDAFEPKYSMWPLLFGTLKATTYAMLISVPLALLAAIYVSQLAPRRMQAIIKPSVELMAAVPSVIVGFLGALWLAPRLEAALLETAMVMASLPLAVIVALVVWRRLPDSVRQRIPPGGELVLLALVTATVIGAAVAIAGPVESRFFAGDLIRYLYTEHGIRYDQRNGLVVGIALGFAVIPVIFTIAEDACSSVPRSLVRAARALGATRWQASIQMVVPAALPGLLGAIILGFGRAVGETMIVLMASGNTPILDGSPFNGMRTMSAAIAVEIPEAAVGGTHFRVLFLTGLLLFVFSFLVTTAADSVSRRLRRRYARL